MAIQVFKKFSLVNHRAIPNSKQENTIEKKPATRELINWIRALKMDPEFHVKNLEKGQVPYLGVLFKKSADYAVALARTARVRRL